MPTEPDTKPITSKEVPLGITTTLFFLIMASTLITYIIPRGDAAAIYYFQILTGPFNISREGNIFGNVIILLLIFAAAELYLKITNRGVEVLAAFMSSVVATYMVDFYLTITSSSTMIIGGSGTSIIGASMLLLLITVIILDMIKWSKRLVKLKPNPIFAGLKIGIAFVIMFAVVQYLIRLYINFYVIDNQSLYYHVFGSIFTVLLTGVILVFRSWILPRDRHANSRRGGNGTLPNGF